MSYNNVPNHSYLGQYYFNPQWIEGAGDNPPSVIYGNVVNFSVGVDGTHYFYDTFTGQFIAPTTPTVASKVSVAPLPYDEAVKPPTEKASGSDVKESGCCGNDKTSRETGDEENYSSDEDVWATEDEEYDGNYSDSSQDEYNGSYSVRRYQ
ncbi:hypothetical protein OS493_030653 [Desmophyllum pertusum]|uniref:Uncharacterized protein n=1 Tax=Desmophyllum pertusum TaxID=174260 RepID=A0A9W9ZKC6_9CNID|nr:hypothetical protein OS493_030653 [Desmophyllum pertusum]